MSSKFQKVVIDDYSHLSDFCNDALPVPGCNFSCSMIEDRPGVLYLNLFHDKTIKSCIQFSKERNRIVKISVPKSQETNESAIFLTGVLNRTRGSLCNALCRTFSDEE